MRIVDTVAGPFFTEVQAQAELDRLRLSRLFSTGLGFERMAILVTGIDRDGRYWLWAGVEHRWDASASPTGLMRRAQRVVDYTRAVCNGLKEA